MFAMGVISYNKLKKEDDLSNMADKPVKAEKKKQPNWRQKRKKRAKRPVKEQRRGGRR